MRLFKVMRELMNLHLQPQEDLDHYFHRLDSMVDELNAHQDFAPPMGAIIAATLAGLPSEYRVYIDHVEHTHEELDLATIRNGLLQAGWTPRLRLSTSTRPNPEAGGSCLHRIDRADQSRGPPPGGGSRRDLLRANGP